MHWYFEDIEYVRLFFNLQDLLFMELLELLLLMSLTYWPAFTFTPQIHQKQGFPSQNGTSSHQVTHHLAQKGKYKHTHAQTHTHKHAYPHMEIADLLMRFFLGNQLLLVLLLKRLQGLFKKTFLLLQLLYLVNKMKIPTKCTNLKEICSLKCEAIFLSFQTWESSLYVNLYNFFRPRNIPDFHLQVISTSAMNAIPIWTIQTKLLQIKSWVSFNNNLKIYLPQAR